ncbi:universal stress protein [Nonomuraea maheshkhaliensis]|uniref:universal stress protein n=1 Tax=Nonomuraea maheshkhaliensis TaxID=419590 RepID=UPI0031F81DE3
MIIVGVDGSAESRAAVEWAAGDAVRRSVPLHIVHVTDSSCYLVGKRPEAVLPDTVHQEGRRVLPRPGLRLRAGGAARCDAEGRARQAVAGARLRSWIRIRRGRDPRHAAAGRPRPAQGRRS